MIINMEYDKETKTLRINLPEDNNAWSKLRGIRCKKVIINETLNLNGKEYYEFMHLMKHIGCRYLPDKNE